MSEVKAYAACKQIPLLAARCMMDVDSSKARGTATMNGMKPNVRKAPALWVELRMVSKCVRLVVKQLDVKLRGCHCRNCHDRPPKIHKSGRYGFVFL